MITSYNQLVCFSCYALYNFFKYGNGSVCKWMLWKITLIYDYTQLNKIQNNVHIRIVTQILKPLGKAYTWGDHGMKTLGHREPQKWFKLPLQHASPLSHLKYTISILWGRGDQTTFITPCQETALQTLCSQLHVSCLWVACIRFASFQRGYWTFWSFTSLPGSVGSLGFLGRPLPLFSLIYSGLEHWNKEGLGFVCLWNRERSWDYILRRKGAAWQF